MNNLLGGTWDARYPLRSELLTRTAAITASATVSSGQLVQADLSGASADVTATLPASPAAGDQVGFLLVGASSLYNLIVALNGKPFRGGTDNIRRFDLCLAGDLFVLEYVDSTTGWIPVLDRIRPHEATLSRSGGASAVAFTVNGGLVAIEFDTIDRQVGLAALNSTPWTITPRRLGDYDAQSLIHISALTDQSRCQSVIKGLGSNRNLPEAQASYGSTVGCIFGGIATLWSTPKGTALKLEAQVLRASATGSPTLGTATFFTLKERR